MAAAHWSFDRHIRNGRAFNNTPHFSHISQSRMISSQQWNCLVYRRIQFPIWTQRPASQPVCKCAYKILSILLIFVFISLRISHCACTVTSTTGLWNPNTHTTQWHVTTQPNFITKPRPTQWDKLPSRPKPKPTKKPIHFTEMSPPSQSSFIHTTASGSSMRPTTSSASTTTTSHTSTSKPKPQVIYYSFFFFS